MALHPGVRWEIVGDDVLGLETSGGLVHRLTGEPAAVARALLAHPGRPVPEHLLEAAADLERAGLLVPGDQRIPRRRMLAAGAAVFAAAGITTVVLPEAAAAASVAGESTPTTAPPPLPPTSTTTSSTTTTTPSTTTTTVPIAHPTSLTVDEDEDQVFSLTLVWT